MRAMKNSGIEWIGEIPQGWKIARIKHVIDRSEFGIKIGPFGSTLANRTLISGPYNVYSQANLISNCFSDTNHYIDRDTFVELRGYEVKPGDVCVSMMGTIGKCKVVPEGITEGIMDSHLIKIRLDGTQIDPRFFEYVYDKDNSGVCFTQMQYEKKGTIMDGLNTAIVKNLIIPLPPLTDQVDISKYLDEKCAEIDALIAAKEKTNALLKERRQSIIYEAVTKGLDPTAPMKDSGVEWIGEIPEGWSVCRIKRVAEIVTGNTPSKASGDLNYSDDGLMWVKPDNLLGNVPVKDTSEHLSDDGCMLAKVVPANTPLTCCIGTIGKVGYSEKAVAFNQQINAICFEESVDTRFGLYCLMAQDEQQKCFANGNVLKILNAEAQGRLFIAIPSLSEQRIIAEHLDMQCQMIDENCAANNVTIQKLKEYRQSLIYEAVTGKIEV